GLWVEAAQPGALAEAARKLCHDPALRDDLAARSLAAAPLHSREHQAERFIRVLELVKAGQGPTQAGTVES
ncbi:MAG TPA: glycosyltransferase WbuB, partial [Candidatus Omnitrophota bacterium]|nr:glycosyltransferase WbuB [Candidatus Omnitrophota bacterium]